MSHRLFAKTTSLSQVAATFRMDRRVSRLGRLPTRCHGYIISNKAMKVRMLHRKLKWEISDTKESCASEEGGYITLS